MSNALALVVERVAARREKWRTIPGDVLPDFRTLPESAIIGSFSVCTLESRQRYLNSRACVVTPVGLETPPSLARDYLLTRFGSSPRASKKQLDFIRAQWAPYPLLARPGLFRQGYYVDIAATYWSIMQVIGWNLDYWPGRWVSPGRAPSDFPWALHKVARNCLVSAGMPTKTRIWVPAKDGHGAYIRETLPYNPLANIQLPALIADVLNAIAAECRAAGAIYINTDGYIAPDYATMTRLVEIVSSWELTPRIKGDGPGWVQGVGSYAVGGAKSKRALETGAPLDKVVTRDYAAWLKDCFTAIARSRRNDIAATEAQTAEVYRNATTIQE